MRLSCQKFDKPGRKLKFISHHTGMPNKVKIGRGDDFDDDVGTVSIVVR